MPEMEAKLTAEITELKDDLRDEKTSRRRYQAKAEKLGDEVDSLRGKLTNMVTVVCTSIPFLYSRPGLSKSGNKP